MMARLRRFVLLIMADRGFLLVVVRPLFYRRSILGNDRLLRTGSLFNSDRVILAFNVSSRTGLEA